MSTTSARILGQVKWFNNKAGYGFITVSDGDEVGKDIFIHYSSITGIDTQYKYLVQGEYVEFVLDKSASTTHEFQATQVSGIKGGKLMCETRRISEPSSRPPYRSYRVPRDNESGSRDGGEFTKVEYKHRKQGVTDETRAPPRARAPPRSKKPVSNVAPAPAL